jgi:hypothetical protein
MGVFYGDPEYEMTPQERDRFAMWRLEQEMRAAGLLKQHERELSAYRVRGKGR